MSEHEGLTHKEMGLKNPEKKEYSFEEGASEIVNETLSLLHDQEGVVIGVVGSSIDVGKTYLSRQLLERLSDLQIPALLVNSPDDIGREHMFDTLRRTQKKFKKPQYVFIVADATSSQFPESRIILDKILQSHTQERQTNDLPITKYDLMVRIYSPVQPFISPKNDADIVIRNDEAKKK